MTNVESYQKTAVEALESGNLFGKAAEFVKSIKNYDKKKLRKLSSAQFKFLRDIANDN